MNRTFLDAMLDRMDGEYWSHALDAIASSESVVTIEEATRITNKVQDKGDERDKVVLLDILGNSKGNCLELHQLMIAVSDTDRVRIASLSPLCALYKRASKADGQVIEQTAFEILEQLGSSKMSSSAIKDVFCVNMNRAAVAMMDSELTVSMVNAAWHNNYLFEMVAMPAFSRLIEQGDNYALQDVFDELCDMEREPHDSISLYFLGIISSRIQKGTALRVEQRLLARLALWEPAAIDFMRQKSAITWEAIVTMAETIHQSERMPSTIVFAERMFLDIVTTHRGGDKWEDAVTLAAQFGSANDIAGLLEGATDEEEGYIMSVLSGI